MLTSPVEILVLRNSREFTTMLLTEVSFVVGMLLFNFVDPDTTDNDWQTSQILVLIWRASNRISTNWQGGRQRSCPNKRHKSLQS